MHGTGSQGRACTDQPPEKKKRRGVGGEQIYMNVDRYLDGRRRKYLVWVEFFPPPCKLVCSFNRGRNMPTTNRNPETSFRHRAWHQQLRVAAIEYSLSRCQSSAVEGNVLSCKHLLIFTGWKGQRKTAPPDWKGVLFRWFAPGALFQCWIVAFAFSSAVAHVIAWLEKAWRQPPRVDDGLGAFPDRAAVRGL